MRKLKIVRRCCEDDVKWDVLISLMKGNSRQAKKIDSYTHTNVDSSGNSYRYFHIRRGGCGGLLADDRGARGTVRLRC